MPVERFGYVILMSRRLQQALGRSEGCSLDDSKTISVITRRFGKKNTAQSRTIRNTLVLKTGIHSRTTAVKSTQAYVGGRYSERTESSGNRDAVSCFLRGRNRVNI